MNSQVFLFSLLTMLIFALAVFLPALFFRRNDIADVFWGPGFLAAAAGGWIFGAPERSADTRLLVTLILTGIWALRIFVHVGFRFLASKEEDKRYNNWRKEWGNSWIWRSFLQVFLLQGLFLLVINLPLLWVIASPAKDLDGIAYAGIAIWAAGFLFETVADEQLRRYKRNPANKGLIMRTGVWSWSRHPNYFGEVVQWWGLFLLALPLRGGLITLLSPVTITFLIVKVSGLPMLEKLLENRPGWEQYKRTTSIFFPLPPRT
jgi:steroid 5-alpha reductase family enzyme